MCVGSGAGVVCFCFAAVTVCWGTFFSLSQFPWRRTASCAFALYRWCCTHFAPRVEADDLIGEFGKEPDLELLPRFILGCQQEDLYMDSPGSKGKGDSFLALLVTKWAVCPILGFSIRKSIITPDQATPSRTSLISNKSQLFRSHRPDSMPL